MKNQYIILLLLIILSATQVMAVDRTPFYDYSGNDNNVTAANNGAVYNTTERVKNGLDGYTFDGANDYLTITPSNIDGQYSICNFTTNTNLTVAVNLQIETNTFSGMFFKMCHYDGDAVGNGYGFKVVANANRIALQNGSTTVQSSNATGNLTYGQPMWLVYAINANNTTAMYQNGTVVFNGSVQTRNANNSITDNTTIGAQNSGAQRFNGTIFQVLVYKRILSTDEIQNITNGSQGGINPVDTLNLTLNINFRNTTTVNLSVNTGNFSRTIPTIGVGYHTQPSTLSSFGWVQKYGEAGYYSPLDFINAQALFRRSGSAILRSPTDFSNSVNLMTIIDATNLTLGYRTDTTNGTISRNMNSFRQLLNQTASVGGLMMWNFEDTFLQNANNSSPMCNYGTSLTFSATCMPLNGTREAQGRARWIIDVGCFNYSYPICIIGDKNEPYNPGTSNFWLPNGTISQRSAELIREYNESGKKAINDTFVAWGYNISKIHSYSGPSFADFASSGNHSSEDMETNFTIAYPYGGLYSPDYQETHLYTYDVVGSNLPTKYAQWQSRMTNSSYTCNWGITEGGLLDDNDNYNERFAEQAITGEAEVYRLTNTCSQFNAYFQLTYNTYSASLGAEAPAFHTNQLANNQGDQYYGKFGAIKALNLIPVNTSMYTCLTNNTAVTCLYSKVNATKAYVYLVNKQGLQVDIDNITVSGLTINTATRLIQGQANLVNTTTSASGTSIDVGLLYPYGVGTFELALNATNISATYQPSAYIVNITEPNQVQFNITLTNPSNQTYNIVWQDTIGGSPITACVNLTTCTLMQANYTSAGQYNITATITGETNTLTQIWLLQINETTQNISATYTPASPLSVATTDTTSFTYTLTNTGLVSTTSTWLNNGSNITACFNSSSCNLIFSTAGSYNITVETVSSLNNLTNSWAVTSVYTSPACSGNDNLGIGLSRLPSTFAIGGIIITLLMIVGSIYAFNQGLVDVKTMLILCVGIALFMIVSLLFTGATAGTVNSLASVC